MTNKLQALAPLPWSLQHVGDATNVMDNADEVVASIEYDGEGMDGPANTNAARITDCVNACDGIAEPLTSMPLVRTILENLRSDLTAQNMPESAADLGRALRLLGIK